MKRILGSLVALSLLCARAAHAEETTELESLLERPVVSTPSKGAETADVAPAVSSVISAEDLRRYGIRSLDEALNFLSLGIVATNPMHAVEVGSRGVLLSADYGSHMLLLVDGHSLNEPWGGTAYFERGSVIPIELIDRIEILLGPGSVLYGSQAMFGVINIVTKRAKDYSGVHVIAEGGLILPAVQNGEFKDLNGAGYLDRVGNDTRFAVGSGQRFRLFDAPAEFVAQLEYYRDSGPTLVLGPQIYGDDYVTEEPKDFGPRSVRPGVWGGRVQHAAFTEVPAFYGKLRVGDTEFLARAGIFRRGVPYQDSLVSDEGSFDDDRAFERDRLANFEIRTRATLSQLTTIALRGYADHADYTWHSPNRAAEDCPEGALRGCIRDFSGQGQVVGTEAKLSLDIPGTARARTLFGIDARVTRAESNLEVVDRATGELTPAENDYGETRFPLAAYIEQGVSPLRFLDLKLGARLD
jgi:outer membrane receptor for ferrienterochelin and colicins